MLKTISIVLCLALCAGCAGMTPALAGKTTYSQSFSDAEAATVDGPGQTTTYTLNIKAPAGVKLDDITGMQYIWDPEKGSISINKSGTTDSTAQAQALIETNKQLTDALVGSLQSAMTLAAPLVGQSIAGRQANQAAQIQSDAVLQGRIADIVDRAVQGALQRQGAAGRVYTSPLLPAGSPLADIPGTR